MAAFGPFSPYAHARFYTVPDKSSGVAIPDHSEQRISAAEAKRQRKAAQKTARQTERNTIKAI